MATEAELLAAARRKAVREGVATGDVIFDQFGRPDYAGKDRGVDAAVAHGGIPDAWSAQSAPGSPALAAAAQAEEEKKAFKASTIGQIDESGGPMGKPSLADEEKAASEDADHRAGEEGVTGQTALQRAQGAQADLDAYIASQAGGGKTVVGYTKGGMVPAGATQQVSKQQNLKHPGYEQAVEDYLQTATGSAVAGSEREKELLRIAQEGARTRQSQQVVQAWADRKFNEQETLALADANAKVESAMADFKKSGPKMMTYRDIWEDQDAGGIILSIGGFLAGAFGGARSGRNAYLDELDKVIDRKLDIQTKRSEISKAAVGQAQTAYEVLKQRFRDTNVARKALHAIYLGSAEQHAREQAARLGVASDDARLLALLEPIALKKVELLKEVTGTLTEQSSESQKYSAPSAIYSAGTANLPKDLQDEVDKYEEERRKLGIPQMYEAATLIKSGAERLSARDQGIIEDALRRKAITDPKSYAYISSQLQDPEALQRIVHGVNTYLSAKGGKVLPPEEAVRYAAGIAGGGDKASLLRGADILKSEPDSLERSLQAQLPRGYKIGNLRRKVNRGGDQPHEFTGQTLEPDLSKNVTPNVR